MLDPDNDLAYVDIAGLEAHIMSAVRTRNVAALDAVLADDFLYRSPAAPDSGRAVFMEAIRTMPYDVLSLTGEGVRAAVFDNVAVVTGVQVAVTQQDGGKEMTSRSAFTDVFVRRDDQWKLVLAYGVDLPAQ